MDRRVWEISFEYISDIMKAYKIRSVLLFLWSCSFCLANDADGITDIAYDTVHLNNVLKVYPKSPFLNGSFTLSPNELDFSHSDNNALISLSVFLSRQDVARSILITSCDVDLDMTHLKKLDSYFLHVNWVLEQTVLECFLHLYDYQNFTTINSSSLVHQSLFGRSPYFVHFSLRRGAHPLDVCVSDFSISNLALNLSTTCLAPSSDRLRTIDFSKSSSALLHNLDRIGYDASCCSNCDQRCKNITALHHAQHNTASTVTHIAKTTVTPVLLDQIADVSSESLAYVNNTGGRHVSEPVIQHLTVTHHFTNTSRNVTHVYTLAAQNTTVETVHLQHSTPDSITLQSTQSSILGSKNNDSTDRILFSAPTTPRSSYITPFRTETIVAPEFDTNSTNFVIQHNFVQNQSLLAEVPVTDVSASTVCSFDSCLNDGICQTKNDSQLGYVCQCNFSYYGDRCQYYDYCKNSFDKPACLNGGLCKSLDAHREQDFDVAGKRGWFSCTCLAGYSGIRCEIPLLTTTLTPTAALLPTSAVLTAKRRPTLSLTAKDIVCDPNPCQHNGTCSPAPSLKGFQCDCTEEWSGDDCSQRRHITTNLTSVLFTSATSTLHTTNATSISTLLIDDEDCRLNKSLCHRGICDDFGQCRCDAGHTGKHCEISLKDGGDPCFLDPCQNNATCYPTDAADTLFTCRCAAGFRGVFCNETAVGSSDAQASSTNVGAIVGGVFGALALVGLAVAGYFLYKYISKSRKLKGKYNPAKEEMNTVGGHPVPLTTLNTGERLI